MRFFIAVELPEEIKEEILEIQKQLPNFEGKKIERGDLHLTLKFLGEVSEEKMEKIRKKLEEIKWNSFKVKLDSVGFFDNRKTKVIYPKRITIWVGVKNCEKLQSEIDEKLENFFEKEKRFMGHLTIARVKNIKDKKNFLTSLKKINVPPSEFIINNFILKKSIPSVGKHTYQDIQIYPLEI